jgi:hypothetical protein
MDPLTIQDLAASVVKGDVALWLGPDWDPGALEQHHRVLGQQPWLGVWSEAKDPSMARWLTAAGASRPRLVIEVPDRVEDALGEHYSIAEACPYFYLRGRGTTDPLRGPARRMARDAKIAELGRLRQAVLIVTGYRSAAALATALEEIDTLAPDLRAVIMSGASDDFASELEQLLAPDLRALRVKLRVTQLEVGELLREAIARRPTPVAGPTLRIGNASVPLAPFASRDFPIDGDFVLLTEADIRAPENHENLRELFTDLISGRRLPWRPFAHQLAWRRSPDQSRWIGEWVARIRQGDVDVIAVDVPAEAGAGLTTSLRQIAFSAADRGCPSLLFRGNGHLHYDRLRSFLTDLYQHESIDSASQRMPAVVVFDAQDTAADSLELLNDLPGRLARDGRRAIVLRGIPVREGTRASSPLREGCERRPKRSPRVDFVELECLVAGLSNQQQEDLAAWVTSSYDRIDSDLPPAAVELIRRWNRLQTKVPLLVCLYFMLRDQFTEVSELGRLLVRRVNLRVAGSSETASTADPDRKLTREEIVRALRSFGQGPAAPTEPTAVEIGPVLLALCAAGTLNARLPYGLLGDLAQLDNSRVLAVLTALNKADLVDLISASREDQDRMAPLAFYRGNETASLRHPAYGRLILEWLASDGGAEDFALLGGSSRNPMMDVVRIARRKLVSSQIARLPDYPIDLFEPILRQLRPRTDHVRFAQDFTAAYMRFQKNKDRLGCPGLAAWQHANLDLLIEAFGWLNDQVVHESASLLHSRAITTYKSCRETMPIGEQRHRYRRAIGDLQAALALAREQEGEHPGNVITSLGLLYLGWAEHERTAGHLDQWRMLDSRVEATLREARQERADNPFAAYGLARYLVERVRRSTEQPTLGIDRPGRSANPGQDLAEALELLAGEPEPNFEDEWRELQRQAVALLSDPEMDAVTQSLQHDGKDLGYSLEALRILGGRIPDVPTEDTEELAEIRQAAAVLNDAEQAGVPTEALGNLLRYALFSADADRLANPRFAERFSRIAKLEGTLYLEQPLWLFDYAMLCFQVGKYDQAAEAFAKLRRGKRFFEVSRERSRMLTEGPDSLKARPVFVRIVSADDGTGKGWCRVEHPIRLRDPMPFYVRSFESRDKSIRVGTMTRAYVSINPAGPLAEPEPR